MDSNIIKRETDKRAVFEKNTALQVKEDLWLTIQRALSTKLDEMEKLLQRAVFSDTPAMQTIIDHIFSSKGKRLRPTLLLLCGSFKPVSREETLIKAAAAVELIHTASLIHDDIIDGSLERRGKSSVNALCGNHSAVLAGDFLFARAFELLACCRNYDLNKILTMTISVMCEGEIEQRRFAFNISLTEEQYLRNIYRKTGALMEACCLIGARLSGLEETTALRLEAYGRNLGLAFQITDDIMDIIGEPRLTGKPRGNDLREGIITLPLIYILEDPLWGYYLQDMIKNRDFSSPRIDFLRDPSCLDKPLKRARMKAREYIQAARECLTEFKGTVEGEILEALAEYILHRSM